MKWNLPDSLEVGRAVYAINADYRDILNIIFKLENKNQDEQIRLYVCLALFYKNFDEMPECDYQEASEKLFWFISCGEEVEPKAPQKLFDWNQDYQMIVSDINKVAGHDIRSDKFCHWWTFISCFYSIGEGLLSTVVSIREKLRRGKKLEKWEREYYNKNRSKIDFKKRYTPEENELIKQWTGR